MRLKQRRSGAHRRRVFHSIDQSGLGSYICQCSRLLFIGLAVDMELGSDLLNFLLLFLDALKKHVKFTLQFFRDWLFTTV